MLKKLFALPALAVMIICLSGCNNTTPVEVIPMESVPTDVKVAIFPNEDLFGRICKEAYLEPNMVQQQGSVLFYDGNTQWYTAALTSTEDMMKYLDKNTSASASSDTDNVYYYSLNGRSYFILSNQLWTTTLKNASPQDLFSIIDRSRKSALSSVKVVTRLQSETPKDSILAVSKQFSNYLMLPADAWLCGKAAYSKNKVEQGWIQAFSPSGIEYPMLEMLSPFNPELLSYLPQNCIRIYGMGCDNVNWQTIADEFAPQLPLTIRAMMSSIVKCLQQIEGTVVCGVTPENLQVLVVQTPSPANLKSMIQERLAYVGMQNIMNLYPMGNVLIITNHLYTANPDVNRFESEIPQGTKAALILTYPNSPEFENAFLVGNRVQIKGIF